jgi:ribosomal protein S18 acetylase RimI-like enzyme
LTSFIKQKLLPGYVAVDGTQALGYVYFLTNNTKGFVGNTFVRRSDRSNEISDSLLSLSISGLKALPGIQRVEAQIMPFNGLSIIEPFIHKGFRHHPRSYLTLDLESKEISAPASEEHIISWDRSFLPHAAQIISAGYRNQSDSEICSDYRTLYGCESYLYSILQNPGCGIFLSDASYIALDSNKSPCAFILGSCISEGTGMIPQIAVLPQYQEKRLGSKLMSRCLNTFKKLGYRKITLTVTNANTKAYDWYTRLGFSKSKDFGAFSWDR